MRKPRDREEAAQLQYETEHTSPQSGHSLLRYLVVLAAAALLLLMMAFLMQQRANQAALENLQQTSHSAVESLENLYREKDDLEEQLHALQKENEGLSEDLASAQAQTEDLQASFYDANRFRDAALDLFLLEEQMRLEQYEDAARTYKRLVGNVALVFQSTPYMTRAGVSAEQRCIEIAQELIDREYLTEEEARIDLLDGSALATGTQPEG